MTLSIAWEIPARVAKAAAKVPTRHDPAIVAQALARYDAGMSRQEIARELHVLPNTLHWWVKRSGLPLHGARPAQVDQRTIQRTVDVYRATGSLRKTAKVLGHASENSVRMLLRRHAPDALTPLDSLPIDPPKAGDPQLPVEPLAQLLDRRVETGALIARIAEAAGVPERRINAIRNREYSTVRLTTADAVCLAVGEQLSLIYPPELEAA